MKVKSMPTFSLAILLLIIIPMATLVSAQALTVSTNKATYIPGETVLVSGSAPAGSYVGISIVSPEGKEVDYRQVVAGSDNTYTASFTLPRMLPYGNWVAGTYTVRAYLGASTDTTTFVLSPGARVLGKVVDGKGLPVAGAEVMVVEKGDSTTSKSDGTFELYTSPGTYTLKVSKAGYVTTTKSVTLTTGDNNVETISLMSLEDEINALRTELKQLSDKVADLEKKLNDLITNVTGTLSKLRSDLITLSGKVDALSKDLDTVKNTLNQLAGTVNTLSGKVDTLSKSLSDLNTKVTQLSTQVDTLSKTTSSLQDAVNKLTPTVDGLRTDINSLRTDLNSVKSDVATLKTSVESVRKEVGGKADAATTAAYVAVAFALLACILSAYSIITIRKAAAPPAR